MTYPITYPTDPERNSGTLARKALRDAVRAASHATSWPNAQLEWDIVGWPDIDDECGGVCRCTQEGLKYQYTVCNRVTGATLYPIGSTCIIEHFGAAPAMMAELATHTAIARVRTALRTHAGFLDLKRDLTPTRIRALHNEGVIDAVLADELLTLRRRRRPLTLDQHVRAERVLREVIAPALGGGSEAEIIDDPEYRLGHRDAYMAYAVSAPLPTATSAYVIGHRYGLVTRSTGGAA